MGIKQVCRKPERQVAVATKCAVAPNVVSTEVASCHTGGAQNIGGGF
jgi:hypothetical protein